MDIKEYLKSININEEPIESEDGSWVIDLINSDAYGKMYTKLDKTTDLEMLDDNQIITIEGGSITFESQSQPIILTLISDWNGDTYSLIINRID